MKLHAWHTFFLVFYVALAWAAYAWLSSLELLGGWIPLSDAALITLAIFRLVRLASYDVITQFVRDWFAGADPASLRGTLATLVNCPWCTGLWFSLIIVFAYFLTPIAWYAIVVLALSAAASFLQLLANLIGWSAEVKKKEAQSIPLPR